MLASWADAARKHEVEQLRFSNLIICVWIPQVMDSTQFPDFRARIIIELFTTTDWSSIQNCNGKDELEPGFSHTASQFRLPI